MSQTDQLLSKTIELQRNALENGQRAVEQAVELPLRGSVTFQRNAAQLALDSLEIGNWLGTQSVAFTRDALDSYLDTVESAARDTSRLTERGIRSVEAAGHQGSESTQQFASDLAGDGRAVQQPQQFAEQTDRPSQAGYAGPTGATRQPDYADQPTVAPRPERSRQTFEGAAPPAQGPAYQQTPAGGQQYQSTPDRSAPMRGSQVSPQPQPRPPSQPQSQPQPQSQSQPRPQFQSTSQTTGTTSDRTASPAAESKTIGAEPTANRRPPTRSGPDAQRPPRQVAVGGENEPEAEPPADNA